MCSGENGKYLVSIINDSSDGILVAVAKPYDEQTKTVPTSFDNEKVTYKTKNF